jgi:hypothetical protein
MAVCGSRKVDHSTSVPEHSRTIVSMGHRESVQGGSVRTRKKSRGGKLEVNCQRVLNYNTFELPSLESDRGRTTERCRAEHCAHLAGRRLWDKASPVVKGPNPLLARSLLLPHRYPYRRHVRLYVPDASIPSFIFIMRASGSCGFTHSSFYPNFFEAACTRSILSNSRECTPTSTYSKDSPPTYPKAASS